MNDHGYITITSVHGTSTVASISNWSWEGHGPMPKDGPNPENAVRNAVETLWAAVAAQERGAQVTDAISALHIQHRSNGMPPRWLPG